MFAEPNADTICVLFFFVLYYHSQDLNPLALLLNNLCILAVGNSLAPIPRVLCRIPEPCIREEEACCILQERCLPELWQNTPMMMHHADSFESSFQAWYETRMQLRSHDKQGHLMLNIPECWMATSISKRDLGCQTSRRS
jgi:hypothetical protein